MKLGILRTDNVIQELVEEFGEYPEMFARLFHAVDPTLETRAYNVLIGEYPENIDYCDAYLITGSKASVYDDRPWIHPLGDFIKLLHERRKKIIGICFGHQMIAQALGGKTEKAQSGWHLGNQEHQVNHSGREMTKMDSFKLIFSHQDQVIQPAPGSTILASTEACPIAMLTIGDHILSIQAHPEFEAAYAKQLIHNRKEIFDPLLYKDAIQSLKHSDDSLEIAKVMLEFIKM